MRSHPDGYVRDRRNARYSVSSSFSSLQLPLPPPERLLPPWLPLPWRPELDEPDPGLPERPPREPLPAPLREPPLLPEPLAEPLEPPLRPIVSRVSGLSMEPDSLRGAAPLPLSTAEGRNERSPGSGAHKEGTTAPEGAGPELVGRSWRDRFESSTEPCVAELAIHVPARLKKEPGNDVAKWE